MTRQGFKAKINVRCDRSCQTSTLKPKGVDINQCVFDLKKQELYAKFVTLIDRVAIIP